MSVEGLRGVWHHNGMRRDPIGYTRYGNPIELFWEIRHGLRIVLGFSVFDCADEQYDAYCVSEAFRRRARTVAARDPTQGFFKFDDQVNKQLRRQDMDSVLEVGTIMGHVTSLQRADYGKTLLCQEFRD